MVAISTSSLVALPLLFSVASAGCSGHRRHHSKAASSFVSSTQEAAASVTASASSEKTVAVVAKVDLSGTTSDIGWGLKGMTKNGIAMGWLPDDGSGGGTSQTIFKLEESMGQKTSVQGWYAQAHAGTLFDGGQLLSRMDQIQSGGTFQPAVMPIGGWWGLTAADNQQAVAICKVMKQFTDKGIETWLRFAHEVNYYQADGTYQGDVNDFKAGWAAVAAACKEYAPKVKMFFTPNVANLAEYQQFYPDDPNTVDVIGIDYYPKETYPKDFVSVMKPFHDAYTNSRVKFAIGEIGLGGAAPVEARLAWAQNIMSSETKSAMPNFIACAWFNYMKGYDFRIAGLDGQDSAVKAWFAS